MSTHDFELSMKFAICIESFRYKKATKYCESPSDYCTTVMEVSEGNSIKKLYDGAEIFITGGSGFVGKALIEKLLRSCPGIKRIYLLMRLKKGTNAQQRLQKLTENSVSKISYFV